MILLLYLTMILLLNIIIVDNHQFKHPNGETIMMRIINKDADLGYINVRSPPYNATGDGVTDDTNAFQQALDDVGNLGGGIVFVPEGNYLIATQLSIPATTVLKGVASHVQRSWGDPTKQAIVGTTLLAVANAGNDTGEPFISLSGQGSGIEGLQIFYPNQKVQNPPIAYPWTIQCGQQSQAIDNTYVKNVLLVNPWKGIDAATYHSGRHWFENVYGQPLSIGIAVDQCYDIGRINHIHFSPFWSGDPIIRKWVENNGISFLFLRTDWEIVEDVFSIGYHIGMSFQKSVYGSCNGQFTDINFDNVDIGIEVYYTQTWGILFSNLNLANAGGGSNRIGILGRAVNGTKPTDAAVVVRGASFWGQFQQNLLWSHVGLISISDSLFSQWNKTSPAIEIQHGRAMINNNYFSDNIGNAITISRDADKVTITNNHLNGNTINAVDKPNILVANNLA
jgi:hypothetical protein